ncbi:helix-turn-helix domain-containing protein [Streptomyces indicus]|uniref:Helix-turn-helix domain-containing protein n=1 Tax=Streptomyces indicus TaxID=417292 RepID=A0A1G8XRA7_9ACTN|nr:XRE family transcriptional regulator [Streptomyces indicus]SDJ93088.1 Protein of unknown function [Streptomyces indicus]
MTPPDRNAPPELHHLAARLRALRDRSGLSLDGLAARTHRGASSWARYLRGTALPPRTAVEELCRAAAERPQQVLALWELAEAEWSGRARTTPYGPYPGVAGEHPPPAPPAPPAPTSHVPTTAPPPTRHALPTRHTPTTAPPTPSAHPARPARRGLTVLLGLAAAVAVTAGVLTFTPGTEAGGAAEPNSSAAPGCTGRTCEGQDPLRMGCGAQGRVTSLATHRDAAGRRIELRYGKPCAAVWARAAHLRAGDRMDVSLPGAPAQHAVSRGTDSYLATPMTPAAGDPQRARVCLTPADGTRRCFTA